MIEGEEAAKTAHARQETVDPVKALGRYLGFGLAGSALIGLAGIFLTLGLLRLLQTETGSTFTGHLSWVPYIIMFVASLVLAGAAMAGWNATRPSGKEDQA